jgi:hypothetical protein
LRVGQAARRARRHPRHDRRVEAVAVERDDDTRSFRYMPQSCLRFDFTDARAADAAQADLPWPYRKVA